MREMLVLVAESSGHRGHIDGFLGPVMASALGRRLELEGARHTRATEVSRRAILVLEHAAVWVVPSAQHYACL